MKIFIEHLWHSRSVRIWAEEEQLHRRLNIHYDPPHGLVKTEIRPDFIQDDLTPLLELPYQMYIDLKDAFAQLLQEEGVKTKNENLIEGKLSATESHNVDLKSIVDQHIELMKLMATK